MLLIFYYVLRMSLDQHLCPRELIKVTLVMLPVSPDIARDLSPKPESAMHLEAGHRHFFVRRSGQSVEEVDIF
jgi:hypothetical protein